MRSTFLFLGQMVGRRSQSGFIRRHRGRHEFRFAYHGVLLLGEAVREPVLIESFDLAGN